MHGSHGAGGVRIIPESEMQAYERPPKTIPRVSEHRLDWIEACRGEDPASSNFDYAGPLTEVVLLNGQTLGYGLMDGPGDADSTGHSQLLDPLGEDDAGPGLDHEPEHAAQRVPVVHEPEDEQEHDDNEPLDGVDLLPGGVEDVAGPRIRDRDPQRR